MTIPASFPVGRPVLAFFAGSPNSCARLEQSMRAIDTLHALQQSNATRITNHSIADHIPAVESSKNPKRIWSRHLKVSFHRFQVCVSIDSRERILALLSNEPGFEPWRKRDMMHS